MTDHQVLQLMIEKLCSFEAGRMPLHQLVGELKALQDSLCAAEEVWLEQFDKERFVLEEINALRLDEDYSGSNDYDNSAAQRVDRLKALIEAFPNSTT